MLFTALPDSTGDYLSFSFLRTGCRKIRLIAVPMNNNIIISK